MSKLEYTQSELAEIIRRAQMAAHEAAQKYFNEKLNGVDQYACGFAWVNINGIKGNTKLGKAMIAIGLRKDWTGKAFQIWNPSGLGCQNVDVKEVGAIAAAEVLRSYGFNADACSRLD